LAWGCGLHSTGSGQGPVAGCCECGDEPSGSCAMELVIYDTYGVYRNGICYFHAAFNCYLVTTSEAQRRARGAGIVTHGVQ
jgi:hypothetical protein